MATTSYEGAGLGITRCVVHLAREITVKILGSEGGLVHIKLGEDVFPHKFFEGHTTLNFDLLSSAKKQDEGWVHHTARPAQSIPGP